MRLYQMDVTQTDCPHVKTSSKFPSIYIIIMNTQFRANYQNMFTIFYSYDPVELEKGIDYFTTRERVQDFELISKRDNIISTYYKYTTTSLFKTIREVGFRLHPMIVHKGIERWYFISEEDREVTEDSINDDNTVVVSLSKMDTKDFLERYLTGLYSLSFIDVLSDMEESDRQILKNALVSGYFDWPRKIGLTELGKNLRMPKSTLSYHVRKIERKIAEILGGDNNSTIL